MERGQIADLAYELLRVLDGDGDSADQDAVEAAWHAEFRRRIDEVETGKSAFLSHEETVTRARDAAPQR